jgi:hypothetical protein
LAYFLKNFNIEGIVIGSIALQENTFCWITGSHGGGYEECGRLDCNAV